MSYKRRHPSLPCCPAFVCLCIRLTAYLGKVTPSASRLNDPSPLRLQFRTRRRRSKIGRGGCVLSPVKHAVSERERTARQSASLGGGPDEETGQRDCKLQLTPKGATGWGGGECSPTAWPQFREQVNSKLSQLGKRTKRCWAIMYCHILSVTMQKSASSSLSVFSLAFQTGPRSKKTCGEIFL